MNANSLCRRYCRKVRQWLPGTEKLKNRIIHEIQQSVLSFLSEAPGATYAEIEARFGLPQVIASSYIDEMDTALLLKEIRIKRKIVKIIFFTALTALALCAISLGIALYDAHLGIHGYGVFS